MDNMMRHMALTVLVVVSAMFLVETVAPLDVAAGEWPKELQADGKRMVVYQPQPEKLVGNRLELRAAVSIATDSDEAPVFGVVWLDAQLRRTPDGQEADVSEVVVANVRFPALKEEAGQTLQAQLKREVVQWAWRMNMDRLQSALNIEEQRGTAAQKISTDPPNILFVDEPAVLVIIDGEPRLKNIENVNLMRVVNTPFTLLFSPSEKRYYLYADKDTWYASENMYDNWRVIRQVPREVAQMAPKEDVPQQEKQDTEEIVPKGSPPKIVISTEPAELISSDGEPEYTPIRGTDLLFMSNTASDVLVHITDRQYYVLFAGRWYRSVSIRGPWTYVAGNDLPSDFARIPEGSRMASVLYAVPGTQEAQEAVLDAHVPTTAAVDINTASLKVEYDGKPEFELIRGTRLYYAVNTATPVIWVGKWYYACDEGIWFVASSPKGPWRVATSVPDAIYFIPPDSPVYHVTFVRVYDANPDVVYVGYTPGYTHTYVYGDTIVYGTGYYWPGWYGRYYYPRPSTWGFDVHWNPWYGWGYGVSYSTGSFRFSIGFGDWYRGSWWGPYYWWDDYPYYYDGYWDRPYYGHRSRYWRDRYHGHRNLYWSKRNKTRVIGIPESPGSRPGRSKGISRPNPERKYYKDRTPREPSRRYPDRQTGPKEKWLQHNNEQPPSPRKPSQRAPEQRQPPREQNNPKWGTQQVEPRPPSQRVPEQRPPPREQYNPKWGTQQVDPRPPSQRVSEQVDPRPPSQDYNPGRPGPDRRPDFHGTVSPRGNNNAPPRR